MPPREIYLLSPRQLSPETIAVTFAKTSRSPQSFREIAAELSDQKSAEFHEKWVVGYGHACYDDQTEILTDQGWRCWPQLAHEWRAGNGGFRLATLNPTTGYLEYLSPLSIIAEPYQGPMYRVSAKAIDLCVTPNHRMWVCTTTARFGRQKENYQLIPAADLEGISCVYQLSACWEGPEPAWISLGDCEVDAHALMQMVGFFIGDGYHDLRYHNAVAFHLRKEREITFLRQSAAACGFEIRQHGNGDKYYVIGAGLGDFLDRCYDDRRRKIIPREILNYGPALLASLMDGLLHSDGSVDEHHHAQYCTTSEPLKDQLYELALKLGWAAYATWHEEHRPEWQKRSIWYVVSFNHSRLNPEVNKASYRKQDEWVPYAGIVYCAEMPANHVLYVRRNGRPVWCGNSVAEHAVLHIAFENVSRLAIEAFESNRLASYTEKSTRYQKWDPDSFYTPRVIGESQHAERYCGTCRKLFEVYRQSLEPLKKWVESRVPRKEGESEARYDGRVRSKYVDNCRFLLPAAALANLGMTANARVFENAIRKWLSHPLEEVREIGEEVKRVALNETPTLVKYADRVSYLADAQSLLPRSPFVTASAPAAAGPVEPVTLVDYDPDGETRFLAAVLYRFGTMPFVEAMQAVQGMDGARRAALAEEALGRLGKYDVPLRELEHVTYTVDAVMDQGGYFEVKRHRMMTQTAQRLTASLGWATPLAFEAAGIGPDYQAAMQLAAETYGALSSDFPEEAAYLVPNAFYRRVLMTFNLREAFAFCELRTAPNAHFSVRMAAARVYECIRAVHPLLAKFMRCDGRPEADALERDYFAA
jgi:thymidylate synthase ThyX